ncbi:MAG TPA: carotenoid oxygenase family protein [Streptosporangiaceae bacterium]|nr:carotenoid oxygenase family protein [Streptosporangiaceae bacterium]
MPPENRFRQGAFAPVNEEVSAFDLPVTGTVPAELNGRYLRNGPNPLGLDDPNYHWFLGAGMVHGVRLRGGKAEWYRNRWVRSKAVADAHAEHWPGGPLHENMDFAANTHIIFHGGKTLATVEAGPRPYELTYELDTVGPCDFGGTLPGGFAAHTKLDHDSGELHAIAHFWAWDHVQHVTVDAAGTVVRTTDIPVTDGPMMHDFALTRNYVVLLDLPVTFSLNAVSAGRELPYVWNPDHQARIGLLPRDGSGGVRWIEIEPCWVFHCLNAYDDENGRVVVDLCQYNESFDVSTLWAARGPVTLDRWVIDPAVGSVTQHRLDDRGQEFPRVDDRIVSRPHRYGYSAVIGEVNRAITASGDFGDDAFANALLRHDLAAGTMQAHEFGRDATVGEGVFAPSSADAGEDDGYVMAFVHNPERSASDLVILAAQDFTADPVARVHLPARVPLGFHGNWIPED